VLPGPQPGRARCRIRMIAQPVGRTAGLAAMAGVEPFQEIGEA